MNLWQFETACRCLLVLDMEELVAVGAIADRDYEAWDAFHADPLRWFITHPTKADAVWKAIWRHKPSSQMAEPPQIQDNIVDFPAKRKGN